MVGSNPDPAYRRSRLGLSHVETGDTVHFPNAGTGDTFTIESISPNGNASVRHDQTGSVDRVTPGFFASAEVLDPDDTEA